MAVCVTYPTNVGCEISGAVGSSHRGLPSDTHRHSFSMSQLFPIFCAPQNRQSWAGNRMAVCVTYPANTGCEFSKEETAYVSYQEKTPGEVPP